jgi:prepilin-type N-terminal cleavage/methylation domain-containing protein
MTSQSPTSHLDRSQAGFSLVEALIAVAVLLILFGAATNGLNQTAILSKTVGNRTEMHGSVRGATELMQQEIGQAGRVALPGPIQLSAAVATGAATVPVSTSAGLFTGANVVIGTADSQETVTLTNVAANAISAVFARNHAANEPVQIFGGFGTGVVPPSMANGSTGTVLKLYGDVNDDGQMQYIEYTCDTANNKLYRNVMAWDAASKPVKTPEMILLNNIIANPGNSPCFTYQSEVVAGNTYVTGVAVTLSVRSQQKDHFSKGYQQATKTLLNVSPRNIFLVWSMVSIGVTNRLQPMPATILALLP